MTAQSALQHDPAGVPLQSLRTARLAVAALFFMNGVLFANWVARIPAMQMERGLSHGALGAALLSLGLGALVAMPLAGWLSARHGSARVCRWSAFGYCVALPVLALTPGTVGFVLALFGFGAVHGALDVAMNAQAVEIEHRYSRPIMSSFHALFSAGGLAGAVLGGFAAAERLTPFVHFSLVAGLLAVAVTFFALPHLLRHTTPAATSAPANPAAKVPLAWPSRTLAVLGIIAFCVMMGEGAMADWSALFLRGVAGASEGVAAAGYAAFSIAMAIGRFSGDRLSERFSPVHLVRGSGLLAAGGLALALLGPSPGVSLLGFTAVGAGFAIVVPQVFSAAGRASDGVAGAAVASVTTIGYLGFLLGPPLIGFAAQHFGLRNALGLLVFTNGFMVLFAGGLGAAATPRPQPARRPASPAGDTLQELT